MAVQFICVGISIQGRQWQKAITEGLAIYLGVCLKMSEYPCFEAEFFRGLDKHININSKLKLRGITSIKAGN